MRLRLWQLIVLVFVGTALISAASGAITGLLIKDGIDTSNHTQQMRLFKAQVSGCYRQNIRTASTNKNAAASFAFDSLFAGAVATPNSHATAKQQKLTAQAHARLEDELTTLTWTPVVLHCSVAPTTVELPVAFSTPRPHRPPKISLPPAVDLKLSKATAGPYVPASR